jgi:hypothetical protein
VPRGGESRADGVFGSSAAAEASVPGSKVPVYNRETESRNNV